MKIQIEGSGKQFTLHLPSGLVMNKLVIRMALKQVSSEVLPPDAVARITGELNRIRKMQGSWELVEVNSADGERVTVTL